MECKLSFPPFTIYLSVVIYQVSQEVVVKIQVLWHMMLCKLRNSYCHSGGTCLHLQGSPMVSSCTTL